MCLCSKAWFCWLPAQKFCKNSWASLIISCILVSSACVGEETGKAFIVRLLLQANTFYQGGIQRCVPKALWVEWGACMTHWEAARNRQIYVPCNWKRILSYWSLAQTQRFCTGKGHGVKVSRRIPLSTVAEFLNPYSEFQLWRTGADYKEGPISPLLLNPQLICWLFKSSPIVKYLWGDEKSSDYILGQLHRFIPFLCNPRHICKWRFSFTFWKMGQYLPWACHGWSCNSSIIQNLWFPITTFTVSKELNIVTK